jgi:hypothetical protein
MSKKIVTIILTILIFSTAACSSVLEVNVEVNDSQAGQVSGSGQFEREHIVTLNAKANKGYEFSFWQEDGKKISEDNPLVFPLTKRRNIKAIFEIREYTINASSINTDKGVVKGSGKYLFGEKVLIEAKPKEGFKFSGWEGIESYEPILTFNVEKDIRAIAHFIDEEEKMVEKEFRYPLVSNDSSLLAYKFKNILSVYSLIEKKAVADFSVFNENNSKDFIKAKWNESESIVINYLDKIIIQSLDGNKRDLSVGKIEDFYINDTKLATIKKDDDANNAKIIVGVFDLNNLELEFEVGYQNIIDIDKFIIDLNNSLLIIAKQNQFEILDLESQKSLFELKSNESIKRIFQVNDNIVGIELEKDLQLINLDNYNTVFINKFRPNEYYYLESYKISSNTILAKFKDDTRVSYSEINISNFSNVSKRKVFGLIDGELKGFKKATNSYVLIDNRIFYIDETETKEIEFEKDEVINNLIALNDKTLFFYSSIEPGYFMKLNNIETN